MRTKLLLFPLLILIMISAVIWIIVPDWNSIQQQKVDLDERKEQLKELQNKNAIVDGLIAIYNNKPENVNLINTFVPAQAGNEDIINNLIFYANSQGGDRALSISDISIVKSKKGKSESMNIPDSISGMPDIANVIGERMIIGESPSKLASLEVEIKFASNYDGMKEFFSKIDTLKRSNDIKSFSVSSKDGSELNVTAALDFNYLDKYNPLIVDGAFLGNSLDETIIEKVKKKATADIAGIEVTSMGRGNPFLP